MIRHKKWLKDRLKDRLEENNSCNIAARKAFMIWHFSLPVKHYNQIFKRLQLI
jgi:hypothetical protein